MSRFDRFADIIPLQRPTPAIEITFLNNAEKGCRGNEGAIDVGLAYVTFDAECISGMRKARLLQISVNQEVDFVATKTHIARLRELKIGERNV